MTIENTLKNYENALRASSVEDVMKVYSENPVFMPENSAALEGREKIEEAYRQLFGAIRMDVKLTLREFEEFGEYAYVRTTSNGETTILTNNSKVKESNNEMFIFRLENGDWKIHRYLFATTNPKSF